MKGKRPAKLFRVDRWQRKTKIVVSILLLVLIVVGILSTMMPTREEMLANTSEAMQQRLAEDAQSTRKRLTISYNPLFCVSYLSVSSAGVTLCRKATLASATRLFRRTTAQCRSSGR